MSSLQLRDPEEGQNDCGSRVAKLLKQTFINWCFNSRRRCLTWSSRARGDVRGAHVRGRPCGCGCADGSS